MTRVERRTNGEILIAAGDQPLIRLSSVVANEVRGALAELYDHPDLEHVEVSHGMVASKFRRAAGGAQ
jgi:hypothetical protein